MIISLRRMPRRPHSVASGTLMCAPTLVFCRIVLRRLLRALSYHPRDVCVRGVKRRSSDLKEHTVRPKDCEDFYCVREATVCLFVCLSFLFFLPSFSDSKRFAFDGCSELHLRSQVTSLSLSLSLELMKRFCRHLPLPLSKVPNHHSNRLFTV